jgi:hypothetical protein
VGTTTGGVGVGVGAGVGVGVGVVVGAQDFGLLHLAVPPAIMEFANASRSIFCIFMLPGMIQKRTPSTEGGQSLHRRKQ